MPTGQPNINNFSWKLSSKLILGCIKWTIEANLDTSINCVGNLQDILDMWQDPVTKQPKGKKKVKQKKSKNKKE